MRIAALANAALASGRRLDEYVVCQPEACIFPFEYYGVWYDSCSTIGIGGEGSYPAWCAEAVDENGEYDGAFELCTASNCHAPTPRPWPWPTRYPTYAPTRLPSAEPTQAPVPEPGAAVVLLTPAPSISAASGAPSAAARGVATAVPSAAPTPGEAQNDDDDDDEGAAVFFDEGGVAWSRSKRRTVWYRWILRSLLVVALFLVAALEPLLVLVKSRVSDAHKRTMLFLSVADQAFVACFLIELWYTRRVFFFVEASVVAGAAVVAAALSARLCLVGPGLDVSAAEPRDRRLLEVVAVFVTLDSELLPLLPWRENSKRRDGDGVLGLKHFALKHFARGASLRVSFFFRASTMNIHHFVTHCEGLRPSWTENLLPWH